AEDGIRDFHVTGVQTCALPISGQDDASEAGTPQSTPHCHLEPVPVYFFSRSFVLANALYSGMFCALLLLLGCRSKADPPKPRVRSEERRVGKKSGKGRRRKRRA